MEIKIEYPLKNLNTFGMDVNAEHFATVQSETELKHLIQSNSDKEIRILGGGSNILFTKDVPGLLVWNEIQGISIIEETTEEVIVEANGGVIWHDLVMWTLEQNLGGIENLSLIPGKVGAAPIQNIGAYGVELKDVFHSLDALDLTTGKTREFLHKDCDFGYRDSVFKRQYKGQYCITKIRLSLRRVPHVLNTQYGAIGKELENIEQPTIQDVSKAVVRIRTGKLPDPQVIGNAGSFFKNPEVSSEFFGKFIIEHPNAPHYPLADGRVKLPAGWLIDQCGFKGMVHGRTGCYENQALVLVNRGGATGEEVWAFAQMIQEKVKETFGLVLAPEVNIW